jgi:hypothetical protein
MTEPELNVMVDSTTAQPIPPEVEHSVHLIGPVQFSIEFFSLSRDTPSAAEQDEVAHRRRPSSVEEGGESACLAHLLCPECGVVGGDGLHAKECRAEGARST